MQAAVAAALTLERGRFLDLVVLVVVVEVPVRLLTVPFRVGHFIPLLMEQHVQVVEVVVGLLILVLVEKVVRV